MTVPGVNLICAATFIGRDRRAHPVPHQPQAGGLLGLDPKVRQSGEAPARSGRISKRGSASARWALVEAAWSVVKQPGPLRAFYERIRARRGHGKAIVATARKLAVLFWCMLTRGEDYAHQRPALTKKKLRQLELTAGAPHARKPAAGIWSTNRAIRTPNAPSPSKPRCPTSGWSPTSKPDGQREKWARARHRSAHKSGPRRGKPRGRLKAPDVCASLRQSPAPTRQPNPSHARRQRRRRLTTAQISGQKRRRRRPPSAEPSSHGGDLSPPRPATRPITPPKTSPQPLDFHRSPKGGTICS